MSTLLQKIRIKLFGPPTDPDKAGSTLSSSAPATSHKPKAHPAAFACEIDEETPMPDGDGWITLPNGDRYRSVPGGLRVGMVEDDKPQTRRIREINNPFANAKL